MVYEYGEKIRIRVLEAGGDDDVEKLTALFRLLKRLSHRPQQLTQVTASVPLTSTQYIELHTANAVQRGYE